MKSNSSSQKVSLAPKIVTNVSGHITGVGTQVNYNTPSSSVYGGSHSHQVSSSTYVNVGANFNSNGSWQTSASFTYGF